MLDICRGKLIPPHWLFVVMVLLFLLAGCGSPEDGDDTTATSPTEPPQEEQQLAVSATTLDFGEVTVREQGEAQLEVSNLGSSDLLLTVTLPINPGDQFSVSSPDGELPEEIAARETVQLMVTFSPGVDGAAEGTLRLESTDPVAPRVDISLVGTGLLDLLTADLDGDGHSAEDGDCDDEVAGPDGELLCGIGCTPDSLSLVDTMTMSSQFTGQGWNYRPQGMGLAHDGNLSIILQGTRAIYLANINDGSYITSINTGRSPARRRS